MTRIVPDRLTPEMHMALLGKVSSTDGDGHWVHPDAGYEAAIAASPGQGAVTVQQLEAAAEAAYAEMSYAAVLYDGGEEMPDWTEADADSKALMRRIAKAVLTSPALGLTVQR